MTSPPAADAAAHALHCHPATPPRAVRAITARITALDEHWLTLRWRIEGASQLTVPPFAGRVRRDGLWKTTCLELFAQGPDTPAYREFNLSPSEAWAAYSFTTYRGPPHNPPLPIAPTATWRHPAHSDIAIFDAAIPRAALPALPLHANLCAVIEEAGHVSYWALQHPAGPPDFHQASCFTLLISPAEP